ncbi:hypothetical protein CPAV1605_901 [seawater metagenome]|uniref:Uncharacterized protein n=1 Tax=seawater metagenome TaxID=1561972 RepID=A0A5E8CJ48_9ZZZZ
MNDNNMLEDLDIFFKTNPDISKDMISENLDKIAKSEKVDPAIIKKIERAGFYDIFRGTPETEDRKYSNIISKLNEDKINDDTIKKIFNLLSNNSQVIESVTIQRIFADNNNTEDIKPVNYDKFKKIIIRAYSVIDQNKISFDDYLDHISREIEINKKKYIFDKKVENELINNYTENELITCVIVFKIKTSDLKILDNNKELVQQKIVEISKKEELSLRDSIIKIKSELIQDKLNIMKKYMEIYNQINIQEFTCFPFIIAKGTKKNFLYIKEDLIQKIYIYDDLQKGKFNLIKLLYSQTSIGIRTIPDDNPLLSIWSETLYALNLVKPGNKIQLDLFKEIKKDNVGVPNGFSYLKYKLCQQEKFNIYIPKEMSELKIALAWSQICFSSPIIRIGIKINNKEVIITNKEINYTYYKLEVEPDKTYEVTIFRVMESLDDASSNDYINLGIAWYSGYNENEYYDLETKISIKKSVENIISDSETSTQESASPISDNLIQIEDNNLIQVKDNNLIQVKDNNLIQVKDNNLIQVKDNNLIQVKDNNSEQEKQKTYIKDSIDAVKETLNLLHIPDDVISEIDCNPETIDIINSINEVNDVSKNNAIKNLENKVDYLEKKIEEIVNKKHNQEIDDAIVAINSSLENINMFMNYKDNIERQISDMDERIENINEKNINEKNISEKNIDEKNISEKNIDEKNISEKNINKLEKDFKNHKDCVINSFQLIEKRIGILYDSIKVLNLNVNKFYKQNKRN